MASDSINFSCSASIQNQGSIALSSNTTIRQSSSLNISCNVTIAWLVSTVAISANVTLRKEILYDHPQLPCNATIRNSSSVNLSFSVDFIGNGGSKALSCSCTISHSSSINISMSFLLRRESHRMLRDDDIRGWFADKEKIGVGPIGGPNLTTVVSPKQQGTDALKITIPSGSFEKVKLIRRMGS